MKRLFILCSLCFNLFAAPLIAQEICNNGVDDDNDGFIDCYDNDCAVSTFCKDFYLGDEAVCEATPPAFPKFTMALDFASPDETTNHLSRMAIGDLNRDGIPEIVTMNRYTDKIFILNGQDGTIQREKKVDFDPNWEVAIANVDDDNCGEIFFFGYLDLSGKNNDGYYIFAYDCELNFLWRTEEKLRGDPINYGLADFDGDGKVELYVKDEIYDAHTGTRIVKSTASNWTRINGGPVAVDMEGDYQLELVLGCNIYSVNLGNRSKDAGSLTLLKSRPEYYIRNEYNATSVADYNQDGYLDILASGSLNGNNQNTTVFFWDVHNNTLQTYSDPIDGKISIYACPTKEGEYYKHGWINGTGRINIGDLDGDGKLNASYVSGKYLYALDENMQPLSWSPKLVNEETSGHTGCTLFDFNGDGKSEIVYRDERFLYIINGTDGSIYNQQTCISRTNREYPIVADVDADGSTELCVTCGYDDQESVDNFCTLSYSRYSHVRVYKSASDPWVPARRVWNQHGYFNVNVNDDLTIPIRQQKHHLVFSSGSCTEGPNRPLNTFLNQTPFLNQDGCPTYKSPNIAHVENSLTVNRPTCPTKEFTVSFQITNRGDIGLSGLVPITFYNGNPEGENSTAIKLGTIEVYLNNFDVGAIESINDVEVTGPGGPFILYISLNDAGTSIPVEFPNTNFVECLYDDNIISAPIDPLPVSLTALKIQDNIKCVGSTSPDNGAVRAFVPTSGGGENTANYNFYWSIGTDAKPAPADFTGATLSGIPEGTYTVYAIHKTAGCSTESAQVVVGRVDKDITVTIELLSGDDNCTIANGGLRAIVDADGDGVGEPPQDFTYVWYEGNDIFTDPQVSIAATATGLKAHTYTVVVTDPITGCQSISSMAVPDLTNKPVVTASSVDILCSDANSGSVSANVAGATTGYTFEWYRGSVIKPSADYTTSDVNNLPAGNYTVVATETGTQCSSDPVTVTIGQTAPPIISAHALSAMTSCDATAAPNGSATVSVTSTGTHTFEWFRGQNTVEANRISTDQTITDLSVDIYTVKVTSAETGCFVTAEVTIDFDVETPSLILGAVADMTTCTVPNGSVTVDVSIDTPGDYTFYWYNGASVKATPDYTNDDNTLENIPVGTYTVRAVHRTKHCATAPISATVLDNTPVIQIDLDLLGRILPSDCNDPQGEMEVSVSAPGNTSGFDVTWYYGTAPFTDPPVHVNNGVTASRATNLSQGIYTVVATNLDNGCESSGVFDLPFADAHILNFISQADVIQCVPDNTGAITVELIPTPLPGFDEGHYDIEVYAGNNTAAVPIQVIAGVAGTSQYTTTSTLTPGVYTLVAISKHPDTQGCRSVPVTVEITQQVSDPVITATQINANMNCDGAAGNGLIQLSIDGGAPAANYSFAWFEGTSTSADPLGTNTTGVVSGTGETASGLPAGIYTVEVTNTTPTSTGCSSVATFEVFSNPPTITIGATNLDIAHVTTCDAPNGEVVVQVVSDASGTGDVNDYSFTWMDADMNVLPPGGPPNTTPTIANLAPGIYFVRATKQAGTSGLGCESSLVQFEIKDKTINSVNVELVNIVHPTRCLQPDNIEGELHVAASGNSSTGYTYFWHRGPDTSTPVEWTSPGLTGITVPLGDASVTYTIDVLNNSNNCRVSDTYVLPVNVRPVEISASATPLTYCSTDNGGVFATVSSGSSNDYDYLWSVGDVVKAIPDFTGKQNSTLPAGNYTIIAVDQADNFCQSAPQTVTIENFQTFPTVTTDMVAPLAMCDPTRPDGAARAHVNGNVVNYTFDWYEGNTPTGSPLFTGADVNTLQSTTYTVVATDRVTGCSAVAAILIPQNSLPIPMPQVDVLSHVTSCIEPNGALTASVNGNTSGYIFHWYLTNPGQVPNPANSSFTGVNYNGLEVGTYYASATSRETGCISPPASNNVLDEPAFPDFAFKVEPATCEGQDGFIAIYMRNNIDIASVEWDVNGATIFGPTLQNIPPGTYTVTVTSTMGCPETRSMTVDAEIRPFNGVSRNGDGANDIFHIDCIDMFPTNLVKIFNRAGTLVFEAEGYDNVETYFDGKSNKGISLMGSNLPDGTYFYVIDKRNGSKPVAGYLEVVN